MFSGKRFHVYIANLTNRLANYSKFMILSSGSNAPACVIYTRDDERYMLKNDGHVSTQCNNESTDPTANFGRYNLQEPRDERVDCHNAVKELNESSQTEWQMALLIADQILLFATNLQECLNNSKACWMSTSVQLKRCTTESSSTRQTDDPFILLFVVLGRS